MAVMQDKVKVLYIAGFGRSGSTILDNILGQLDGVFSGGELRSLWYHGLTGNILCGCGERFRECPVWERVLTTAYSSVENAPAEEMVRLSAGARSRHLPLMLLPRSRERVLSGLGAYREHLSTMYRAIQTTTGCDVIVDSSKVPLYGRILQTLPEVELSVVHLMRDPRAVAYSWLRKKSLPDWGHQQYMPTYGPIQSALNWDLCNVASELFWRRRPDKYLLLRYEDFIADPRGSVRTVLDLVDIGPVELPFTDAHTVQMGPSHSVSGNPSRFRTGTVELRVDERWKRKMPGAARSLVSTFVGPLGKRYGYDLW